MKIAKTNALRILESLNIPYEVLTYSDITTGVDVARELNLDPNMVFKTLVTVNNNKEHFVFMLPVGETLDLKKASIITKSKYIELIPQKELLPLTGYVHGGCSPVGMKKLFPTFIDETALLFDYIYFSAGRIGMQVKVEAKYLSILNIKNEDLTL